MAEAVSMSKIVGVIWFLAAVAGIIAAFVVQPFADWGIFAILFARRTAAQPVDCTSSVLVFARANTI